MSFGKTDEFFSQNVSLGLGTTCRDEHHIQLFLVDINHKYSHSVNKDESCSSPEN